MLKAIGAVVRRARARSDLSVRALSARARVPEKSLRALERGRPGVSTTELERIASALELAPGALFRGHEEAAPRPSVFLRHQDIGQDFDHEDLPTLDASLEDGRLLRELRAALGDAPGFVRAGVFSEDGVGGDTANRAALAGYARAREVRARLGNVSEPLGDLRRIIEEQFEIAVRVVPLGSTRVTALSVRARGGAAIVLNAGDPERARNPLLGRVHLAHELCHVLFDRCDGGVQIVIDVVADRQAHLAEQRARAFAAELLLPEQGLKAVLGAPHALVDPAKARASVAKARKHFATPFEIAANHLANHGYIARELREALVKGGGDAAPSSCDTMPEPGAPSIELARCIRRAHDSALVTDGEARKALRLDLLAPLPWS